MAEFAQWAVLLLAVFWQQVEIANLQRRMNAVEQWQRDNS
jgi:hypothetical protein